MKSNKTRELAIMGLFICLTTVLTSFIRFPTIVQGYIHFGDIIIIYAGFLFGSKRGALIGGIGSALADLLGGFVIFIPATLIAKALEGGLTGLIGKDLNKNGTYVRKIIGGLVGITVMVLTYFLYESVVFGIPAAIAELIPNFIQGFTGIIGGLALIRVIKPEILGVE